MNRRRFFWLGATAVTATALAIKFSNFWASAPLRPFQSAELSAEHHGLLEALIRGFLGPALPAPAAERASALATCKQNVLAAISGLAPPAQAEIGELLNMLSHPVGRRLLGGPASEWKLATDQDLSSFLTGLRFHSLSMLRPAYSGLHNIVLGAWYSGEMSWADIGYTRPFNLV